MADKKQEIFKYGKELFSTKGYKDTNVSGITKAAGMATGTFYLYYTSKDSLFMDIYLDENRKLKKRIMKGIDLKGDPLEVIKEMMFLNYKGMKKNPILREWYNRDTFAPIERKYREENGIEHVEFMYDIFIGAIQEWQKEGKMRNDIDCEMIMAIFAALTNIDTHKEEIGLQYFPKLMDYVAEFIMKGSYGKVKRLKEGPFIALKI